MSGGYARRVHRVMDHVRENLRGELSLEALAKVAHFSPYHFHRVFKSVTGETLTRFVQRSRLERAAYLMKSSPSRELGSIAHQVGFSAQSDFSRVFRKHYGVAPSDWDRQPAARTVGTRTRSNDWQDRSSGSGDVRPSWYVTTQPLQRGADP